MEPLTPMLEAGAILSQCSPLRVKLMNSNNLITEPGSPVQIKLLSLYAGSSGVTSVAPTSNFVGKLFNNNNNKVKAVRSLPTQIQKYF